MEIIRKIIFNAIAAILFALAFFGMFMQFESYTESERCYFYEWRHLNALKELYSNVTILEDIMTASYQPEPELSIFFIETNCRKGEQPENAAHSQLPVVNLSLRHACAIESLARINNNDDIFVLFASPAYLAGNKTPAAVQAILSYPNVHLNYINPWTFTRGTPYEKWFHEGELFKYNFIPHALADYLKLIFLWRWGGTYVDLDVLAMRSMPKLSNFIAFESKFHLSTDLMNFAITGMGHDFVVRLLEKFNSRLGSDELHATGRELITMAMKEMCNVSELYEVLKSKECTPIQFLDERDLAPISGGEVKMLFSNLYNTRIARKLKNGKAIAMKVSSKFCSHCKSSIRNPGIYGHLAARNCPKVYSLAKDYF